MREYHFLVTNVGHPWTEFDQHLSDDNDAIIFAACVARDVSRDLRTESQCNVGLTDGRFFNVEATAGIEVTRWFRVPYCGGN